MLDSFFSFPFGEVGGEGTSFDPPSFFTFFTLCFFLRHEDLFFLFFPFFGGSLNFYFIFFPQKVLLSEILILSEHSD